MITERDLQEAIAECQGKRNPDSSTCIKLAAFYTIRNEMYGKTEQVTQSAIPEYVNASYAPGEKAENIIDYNSGTEFSQIIDGRDQADVWPIMDELMDTLMVIHRRLYDGVMRQLQR